MKKINQRKMEEYFKGLGRFKQCPQSKDAKMIFGKF